MFEIQRRNSNSLIRVCYSENDCFFLINIITFSSLYYFDQQLWACVNNYPALHNIWIMLIIFNWSINCQLFHKVKFFKIKTIEYKLFDSIWKKRLIDLRLAEISMLILKANLIWEILKKDYWRLLTTSTCFLCLKIKIRFEKDFAVSKKRQSRFKICNNTKNNPKMNWLL